jgi:hypothetical protein
VDLLQSLCKHAFYTVEFPYGSTARVQITRGKKHGDLIFPLFFALVVILSDKKRRYEFDTRKIIIHELVL